MNINENKKIENSINQVIESNNINKNSRNNYTMVGNFNSSNTDGNTFNNQIDNNNIIINKKENNKTINKNNNEKNRNYATIIGINNENKRDYENKIKNGFFKKLKISNPKMQKEHKNKLSHKTFYKEKIIFSPLKTKNIFPFSIPKKKKKIKSKKFTKTNYLYNMGQRPPVIDKEGLLMEIFQIKNDIDLIEFELIKLKKKRKRLEKNFLANKFIIEGILDIQEENDKVDIKNNTNINDKIMPENTNIKIEPENIEKKEDNLKLDNNFIPKTETIYYKSKNNIEIISLKKQIINCDKNIDIKNKLMERKQNENRVNDFIKMNSSIESKNKTLEELVNKSQTLQYIILDIETRIEFFTVKIKNYIDETIKLNDLINNHNTKAFKMEKDIQSLYLEKESILKKIKLLEDEQKQIIYKRNTKKKEKDNVDNEFKITKDMIEEKNNNEKEITELEKNEIVLKRNIEKNNIIINSISNEKKYFEKKIESYINERDSLIEKSKMPQKSNDNLKNLENEIKNIKNELEENQNYINRHEEIKNDLNKKISEILIELNNKKEENKKYEEELHNIKNKYKSQIPKEYRTLYKDEPEDNEKELNNIENIGNSKDKKNCLIF